jgi:hypothetical protein
MATTEGYFFVAMLVMIFSVITVGFGRQIFSWFIERKGYLGYQVAGWVAVFLLWTQSHVIGDYLGFNKSEIEFAAIVLIVLLVLSIVYRNRETTWNVGKVANKTRKKVTKIKDR